MIAIVNYGSGNVGAISNIYKQLKIPHIIAGDAVSLGNADKYVLPGVGHFDTTIKYLARSGVRDSLIENVVGKGKILLGICVGMQILASSSEEGVEPGLGWIAGCVRRIQVVDASMRLPHMGWNDIAVKHDRLGLFKGVDETKGFYFLHSYHFETENDADVAAVTRYGSELTCAVTNGQNIVGVQFHPEKSHSNGTTIFKNFARL